MPVGPDAAWCTAALVAEIRRLTVYSINRTGTHAAFGAGTRGRDAGRGHAHGHAMVGARARGSGVGTCVRRTAYRVRCRSVNCYRLRFQVSFIIALPCLWALAVPYAAGRRGGMGQEQASSVSACTVSVPPAYTVAEAVTSDRRTTAGRRRSVAAATATGCVVADPDDPAQDPPMPQPS